MDSAETQTRLDNLSQEADALTDAVRVLTKTADRITRRTRRSEMVLVGLVVSFALDIVITLSVFFGLAQLNHTTQEVQATQTAGMVIRQKVLCPLYQLFLESYSTAVRDNPQLNPRGAAFYDEAYDTLRSGNSALHCT